MRRINTPMIRHALAALAAAGSMMCAQHVRADSVLIGSNSGASTESLGSFTGSIDYTFDPFEDVGMLTVSLTNTSDPLNGGYITGFLFNYDSTDFFADVDLVSASHPFVDIPWYRRFGRPFGFWYRAGAGLNGQFNGGGNPHSGVAVGDTGIFGFEVDANDAESLTAESFMAGPWEHDFIVRFRGFDDGGSDKVPANMIPLPTSVAIGALGLLGVMLGARRLRGNV